MKPKVYISAYCGTRFQRSPPCSRSAYGRGHFVQLMLSFWVLPETFTSIRVIWGSMEVLGGVAAGTQIVANCLTLISYVRHLYKEFANAEENFSHATRDLDFLAQVRVSSSHLFYTFWLDAREKATTRSLGLRQLLASAYPCLR